MEAQLKSKGWFFTSEGLDLCKEGLVNPSLDSITQKALDIDLRSLSAGCPDDTNRSKTDMQGPLILQIQKIRNVAAPKMNEDSSHAPKLLRLQLTDGSNFYSGLLLHGIPKIDMNTPPGTKVLIKGKLPLKQGLMLMEQDNTKVLGGHVDEMVERWKLVKTLSQFTRASKVEGAPPPWVPFGQRKKLDAIKRNDYTSKGSKKSLETTQKDLTESDKAFEEQRKAAIQGAGKHQGKKFGGGKVVPTSADRLNEHRRQREESGPERSTVAAAPAANDAKPSQGIYRELSSSNTSDGYKPDEKDLQKLTSMGFPREACISALKGSNGHVDSAVDTLLAGAIDDMGPLSQDDNNYPSRDNGRETDYRGGRYDNRRGGFDSRRGGSDSRRGGSDNRRGGFDSQRGGFDSRRGGFDSRRGGRGSDSRPGGRNFEDRGRGRGSDTRRRKGGDEDDEEEYFAQPSGGTTLFDFLESKLAKDHPNKESGSGNQRSRNYAKEQPPSVRDAGIKFVHPGSDRVDSRNEGRRDRGARDGPSSRPGQSNDNRRGQYNNRVEKPGGQNDRRGSGRRYDSREGRDGDHMGQRSGQGDSPRGELDSRDEQNDRRPFNRRNDGRSNDSRSQADRGPSRPRQDKDNSQRNTQYTVPPRFQKLQETENKRGSGSGNHQPPKQDERESQRGGGGAEDDKPRGDTTTRGRNRPQRNDSQRSNNAPQRTEPLLEDGPQVINGPQLNGDGGPGTYRLQQRPQPNPGYNGGNTTANVVRWNVGDMCVAKYWEDGAFYNATITGIHPTGKTCVVHFIEYGNQEEILASDILPIPTQQWGAIPSPHQFAPPNHIMVPQAYQDTRPPYQGPPQRYN